MSEHSQPPSILSTMESDGSRRWIRPRLSKGNLYRWRLVVGISLMVIFLALPHLRMFGKPLVLLDVVHRQFVLFGTTFLATDAILLMLVLLIIFLSIFWFTALFGRVWCGWACPQTVYMELLFRPIERWIEGPPRQQRTYDKGSSFHPRRLLKNIVFFLIAVILGNTFLAYFVGTDQLFAWIKGSPLVHPAAFGVMAITSLAVFFDFAWFREQTCLVACPYGRLQSVLLDDDSLIVAYDPNRGESRGTAHARRSAAPAGASVANPAKGHDVFAKANPDAAAPQGDAKEPGTDAEQWGDCIDCSACVATCPTGIDIRDGLQMECINCTQCIDACDAIMVKINKPTGLIRYSSQAELAKEPRRLMRARTILYPLAILLLAGLLVLWFGQRGEADVTVFRDGNSPYQVLQGDLISNQVVLKIANHSREPKRYSIALKAPKGVRMIAPSNPLPVAPSETKTTRLVILAPPGIFRDGHSDIKFVISIGTREVASRSHQLLGPQHASPEAKR